MYLQAKNFNLPRTHLQFSTLTKNLGEGSYPTEKQNQEHAFNWKSDNTKKPPLANYMREHNSCVNEIIHCLSRGLALLT